MLATVVRSGMVESWHEGAVAVVDAAGRRLARHGDVDRAFFIRSAAKPVQAAVVVGLGVELAPEELAVVASSHDGEPIHRALTEAVLSRHGLSEHDLRCPASWPLSGSARARLARAGHRRPRSIWHNCSGKHAGMLAACRVRGWDTESYLAADHPLQRRIAVEMERIFGPGTHPAGVDGCGAPVFRCSAGAIARGFGRLLVDDAAHPVVEAMSRYPMLTGGVDAVDAALAIAAGGFAKRGAEGVLGVGLPGRGAVAVKIWDGASRPIGPVVAAVLDQVGWVPDGLRPALECGTAFPVFGGGEQVGSVQPAVHLESW